MSTSGRTMMSDRVILPDITWCAKCVYPSSSAIPLTFDDNHVCSGCLVHGQKQAIDWDQRLDWLKKDVDQYRKPSGYECIIGVSGGKDSWTLLHCLESLRRRAPIRFEVAAVTVQPGFPGFSQ